MIEGHVNLRIIIPTRNRVQLAINAINSVMPDLSPNVRVMVSDNSIDTAQVKTLCEFCEKLGDANIIYRRPDQPLNLGEHWEWALQQALMDAEVTHVLFLTDRMVFKKNELMKIIAILKKYPEDVISYNHDAVFDDSNPIRLVRSSWTGTLFQINSAELLRLSAQMIFHHSLPRMLNCAVPRHIFDSIQDQYGCIFDSIAPDFVFAYRCLDCCDKVLFFDNAALLHYSIGLSTGNNQSKGIVLVEGYKTQEERDQFIQKMHAMAPIPEICTLTNAIVQAYQLVKYQSKNPNFNEINMALYLQVLEGESAGVTDPQMRDEIQELLLRKKQTSGRIRKQREKKIIRMLFSVKSWRVKFWWVLTAPRFQWIWDILKNRTGLEPPGVRELITEFASREEAINYAHHYPRKRNKGVSYLETLVRYNKLPY